MTTASHNQDDSNMIQAAIPMLQTRLDGPHLQCERTEPLECEFAGDDCADESHEDCADESLELWSRVRTQTEQIARYLKEQHRDLDCREARFNAQLAQMDEETRQARLWFLQRQEELAEEQSQLAGRQADADGQAEALQRQKEHVAEREQELAARAELLAEIVRQAQGQRGELRLEARQLSEAREVLVAASEKAWQEIAQREAAGQEMIHLAQQSLEQLRQACASRLEEQESHNAAMQAEWTRRTEALRVKADQLQQQRQELATAAELTALERASLLADRIELQTERAAALQQSAWEKEELQDRLMSAETEVRQRCSALDAREIELAAREQQLFAFQSQLRTAQQETLEVRLATEELWSRLAGTLPPAVLTRSMAEVRSRLAEVYHLAEADLQSQRQSLEGLREHLHEQQEKLATQRRDLQVWQERRQEELDAREAELAAQSAELEVQCSHQKEQETRRRQGEQHCRGEITRLLLTRPV